MTPRVSKWDDYVEEDWAVTHGQQQCKHRGYHSVFPPPWNTRFDSTQNSLGLHEFSSYFFICSTWHDLPH